MDGGAFLSTPRSNDQQSFVQARMQQRLGRVGGGLPEGTTAYQPKLLGLSDGRVGQISVQHIERYHLTGNEIRLDTSTDSRRRIIASAPLSSKDKHDASLQMDPADAAMQRYDVSGSSDLSSHARQPDEHNPKRTRPFEQRHGRRYIRNEAYPLPCDLQELHRQNLKTSLACSVFGRPVCAPLETPPTRVLEVGCGTAYWTSRCHQMFASMGHANVMYTGMDVAPLAPDLRRQGLNWQFVQHDMRRRPWPFEDETFDLVMCKDLSLAVPLGAPSQKLLDECIRLLRVGGILEIWESDHTVRSILPHSSSTGLEEWEQRVADKTATFPLSSTTPFTPTQNRYIKAANSWIDKALEERALPSAPCARIAPMLLQEPDSLGDVGFRRIAIPMNELGWEQETRKRDQREAKSRSRSRAASTKLNSEQLALREAALLAVVQSIESLEPLLKQTSGKNSEEWSYWWASMMTNLTTPAKKPLNGECLELGAFWAIKLGDDD